MFHNPREQPNLPNSDPPLDPFLSVSVARALHPLLAWNKGTRDFGSTSASANRALQDDLDRNEPRIVASYALIGAILLPGGAGLAIDRWAGTSHGFYSSGLQRQSFSGSFNC